MKAPDHQIRKYLRGGCFALAYEAHRISGLPLMALRDSAGDPHHAFVADGAQAWDIRGRLPLSAVAQGCAISDPQISPLPLEELRTLIDDAPYALDAAARAVRTWLVPDGLQICQDPRIQLPVDLDADRAGPESLDLYTTGGCHLFAIAALDLFAATADPLGFRVVTDPEEPFWISETDPDDQIPAVVHVYAVLRGPEGEIALDVFGARPLEAAVAECAERFGVRSPGYEGYPDLEALRDLIEEEADRSSADRRPLWPIDLDGIMEARRRGAEIFGAHPAVSARNDADPSPMIP
jgi:hypothetical protein